MSYSSNTNACPPQSAGPPQVSVECVSSRTVTTVRSPPRNQPASNDLANTPEHLRPGFRGGRVRQYEPSEFGLTGNEEWRHPRVFRDMTFETDAAELESFRQAQPRRPPYAPPPAPNLSQLPEECLDDMSSPAFDLSMPSNVGQDPCEQFLVDESEPAMYNSMTDECPEQQQPDECLEDMTQPSMYQSIDSQGNADASSYVDSIYREIVQRFNSLRDRIARGDPSEIGQISGNDCSSMPNETDDMRNAEKVTTTTVKGDNDCFSETVVESSGMQNGDIHTTRRTVVTRRDNCGNVTSHVEETSTVSNGLGDQLADQQPPSYFDDSNMGAEDCDVTPAGTGRRGSQQRRLNFSLPDQSCASENIDEMTMPSFNDASLPAMSTRIAPQGMPSECLGDVSAPSFASMGGTPRRPQRSMPSQNICDISEPSFGSSGRGPMTNECLDNVTAPSFGSSGRSAMNNECLDNMTMPSFGGTSGASRSGTMGQRGTPSRGQRSMPSQNICDISAPSFGSSGRGPMTNENLDDMSMPSYGNASAASRGRSPRNMQNASRRQPTMPSECLDDVSAPSFGRNISQGTPRRQQRPQTPGQDICDTSTPSYGSSGRGPMPNECLDDMTMPSFGNESSRRQPNMPSECLDNVSAPSFGRNISRGGTPSRNQRPQTPGRNISRGGTPSRNQRPQTPGQDICDISAISFASSGRGPMTNENLDDMTMPSFGNASGPSRRQPVMPSECLDDVSQPSFGRNMSRGGTPRRPQRSTPSQNICDTSAPSFGSSGRGPMTNECLNDMSMPSFGGVSGASRSGAMSQRGTPTRAQRSMPSQNICDVSAPSFGSSGRGPMTNENLDDMSMPSFGNASGASRGRSPRRRQKTQPSQNICDVSAPSFASSGRGANASERLDDMTLPSFGNVSGSSRRQPAMSSECLDDVSQPSFGRSMSRRGTPRRAQKSMPSQNICDISAPSFGSLGRGPMTNENLNDMSMPSYGNASGASRGRSARSMQNASRRQPTMPSECLDNVSAPSFGRGMSRGGTPGRPQRSENICDASAPSIGSSGRGPMTNECLDDMSMPSFGNASGTLRGRSPQSASRRQPTMPSECLDNVSAPSFGRNMSRGGTPSRQQRSQLPGQDICDISAPSFASSGRGPMANECLEDMTIPSFGNESSRRPAAMPSERLDNISAPSFGRSMSRGGTPSQNQRSQQPQDICDISAPSFASSGRGAMPNECIDDMTMPSYGNVSGASRRQPTMPSECLNNVSAPSFGRSMSRGGTPSRSQRSMPAAQAFNTPGHGAMGSECLADMTMPSYGNASLGASRGRTPIRQQRSMPSHNICDVSAPSFGRPGRGPAANECLDNMTMPSFNNTSFGPILGSTRREPIMPSECLDNVSAPSFGRSMSRGGTPQRGDRWMPSSRNVSAASRRQPTMPSECLDNVSAPSFGRSMPRAGTASRNQRAQSPGQDYECLDDMTMPSFGNQSARRQPAMSNECLDDVSAPSFGRSMSRGGTPSRQQRSQQPQDICDISAPSFASSGRGPMTMPSHGNASGASRGRSPRNMQNASRRQPTMPSECLDDVSAPSFGRNISQGGTPRRQQRPQTPGQDICDTSAPSYGSSGRGPMPNECLDDMTMPSFGNESSRRPPNMPSECLDNVSAPSFGRSMSRGGTPSRNQRSQPLGQDICDISAPSFASTGRGPMPNECLDDMTMPSFGNVTGSSRYQATMPSECLDDMSAPSFGRSMSPGRIPPQRQQQPSMPSQQICDVSAPSFASFGQPSSHQTPNECLQDVSMPSFGGVSGAASGRPQQLDNSCEWSENVSGASALRRQRSAPNQSSGYQSEYLEDISAPAMSSYRLSPARSGLGNSRSGTPLNRGRSFPCIPSQQQIGDISEPPSFGSSGPHGQPEQLSQVSMPRFNDSRPVPQRGPNISYPCEQLGDVSAPNYEDSDISGRCVCASDGQAQPRPRDDTTQPSTNEIAYPPRRHQLSMPNEQLEDVTLPSMASGNFSRGRQTPQRGQRNQSSPSARSCLEQLADITQPSMASTGRFGSPFNAPPRQQGMTNEQLNDVTAPSYNQTSCTCADSIYPTSERNYADNQNQTEPRRDSECLDDVTAPTMDNSEPTFYSPTPSSAQTGRTENLDDMTMPSTIGNSTGGMLTGQPSRIDNITQPKLEGSSHDEPKSSASVHHVTSEHKVSRRISKQASEHLADESAPSMLDITDQSGPGAATVIDEVEEIHVKTSTTSVTRVYTQPAPAAESVRLDDMTMPSYESSGPPPSSSRDPYASRDRIEDISMPAFESTGISNAGTPGLAPGGRSNMYVTDISHISQPSFGPSFQSTQQTGYNNSGDTGPHATFHGFSSMDNYAPFDELIRTPPPPPARAHLRSQQPCPQQSPQQSPQQCPQQNPQQSSGGAPCPSEQTREQALNCNICEGVQPQRGSGQPCDMVSRSFPYGRPHCLPRNQQ